MSSSPANQPTPPLAPPTHVGGNLQAGIDVGALFTKVLLLRNGKDVVGTDARPTTMEPEKLAREMVDGLVLRLGLGKNDLSRIIATGQGRRSIGFARGARTEITAFARGAHLLRPDVQVVVDIGGQGIRAMRLGEMGIVADFRTNDKCSTGTGCFLDTMATALEVDMENAGELSMGSKTPETVSCTCTVFAESEVVSLVAKGRDKQDILAGLNVMVSKKVRAMINSMGSHGVVMVAGGVAQNPGVIKSIRELVDREIVVPENPRFLGALGAAAMVAGPSTSSGGEDAPVAATQAENARSFLRALFGGERG